MTNNKVINMKLRDEITEILECCIEALYHSDFLLAADRIIVLFQDRLDEIKTIINSIDYPNTSHHSEFKDMLRVKFNTIENLCNLDNPEPEPEPKYDKYAKKIYNVLSGNNPRSNENMMQYYERIASLIVNIMVGDNNE